MKRAASFGARAVPEEPRVLIIPNRSRIRSAIRGGKAGARRHGRHSAVGEARVLKLLRSNSARMLHRAMSEFTRAHRVHAVQHARIALRLTEIREAFVKASAQRFNSMWKTPMEIIAVAEPVEI